MKFKELHDNNLMEKCKEHVKNHKDLFFELDKIIDHMIKRISITDLQLTNQILTQIKSLSGYLDNYFIKKVIGNHN